MYLITDTITLMTTTTTHIHTSGENKRIYVSVSNHEVSETCRIPYWSVKVSTGEVIGADTDNPFVSTSTDTVYFVNESDARRWLAIADEFITWKSDGTREKVDFRVETMQVL